MNKVHVKKRVFISSTYKDLEPTRTKVAEFFHNLEYPVVRMENFPSDAMKPDILSSEKLKESDIFVLIIGHKYGTIPEELTTSITHNEYRQAVRMLKRNELENIFVFIATDEFKLRSSDIEDDSKRQKLKEFKSEIKGTFRYFANEDDLIKALIQTIHNKPNNPKSDHDIKIFESLTDIRNLVDRNVTKSKQNKIDEAIVAITKFFKPVFELENSDLNIEQPILSNIRAILNEYIPNIVFEENLDYKGRIDRWGIRHVIFRANTAIKLMQSIDPDDKGTELEDIGYEIGENASKDLFQKLINPKSAIQPFIPKRFGAFIELLNYWDSSGGWGELKHIEDKGELERVGIKVTTVNSWILRTENNFLADKHSTKNKDEKEDIKHLDKFWKGYIHGVLDTALKELDIIYASLDKENRELIEIPKYIKVVSVEREEEDINKDYFSINNKAYFSINFEQHRYGSEIENLESIRNDIEKESLQKQGPFAINSILAQLKFVLRKLNSENEERYLEVLHKFTSKEKNIIEKITDTNSDNNTISIDELTLYEKTTNLFLQEFIHSKR